MYICGCQLSIVVHVYCGLLTLKQSKGILWSLGRTVELVFALLRSELSSRLRIVTLLVGAAITVPQQQLHEFFVFFQSH